MLLLILQSSPFPCYLFLLRLKYLPQHLVFFFSKHPPPSICETKFHIVIKYQVTLWLSMVGGYLWLISEFFFCLIRILWKPGSSTFECGFLGNAVFRPICSRSLTESSPAKTVFKKVKSTFCFMRLICHCLIFFFRIIFIVCRQLISIATSRQLAPEIKYNCLPILRFWWFRTDIQKTALKGKYAICLQIPSTLLNTNSENLDSGVLCSILPASATILLGSSCV